MNQPTSPASVQPEQWAGHPTGWRPFVRRLIKQRTLLLMSIPFVLWLIVFKYAPLWGWIVAFQKYKPYKGLWDQTWVGFAQFKALFDDYVFYQVMRNTLAMSFINLILGFITAITLAILLNELRRLMFKRVVQTISYMPHFLSWVVAANIISVALSPDDGIINQVLLWLGFIKEPVLWLGIGHYFWGILGVSEVWKDIGWNTIIYLAALTMIDPALYESAEMDGAGRFKKIWHVTLPSMKTVIVILLIINIGHLMEQGFEAQYLLGHGPNLDYSQNLDIYVLKYGIQFGNYSLAAAAGIFKTVISFILLFSANYVSKRFSGERLF